MLTLFSVLIISSVNSAIVHPGAKLAITQSTFQNFINAYSPYLSSKVNSGNISDKDLNITFMLTTMKFHLKNIKIPTLKFPENSGKVTLSTPDLININFTGVDLLMTADFDLQWFGKYKGNTTLLLQDAVIQLPIYIKRILNRPVISFGKLEIVALKKVFKFHSNNFLLSAIGYGEYVWPINKLENFLIWQAIEGITKNLNPTVNEFFKNLNYSLPINNTNIALDYSFVEVFVSNPGYLDMGIVGGFLIPSNPADIPPIGFMNATVNWITTADFRLQLTDYFFYSYFWALSETGVLNTTVSAGTQPEMAAFLTTTALQLVIPGLYNTYGPDWPVNFVCGVGQYPNVYIYPANVTLNFSIYCTTNVIQSIITIPAFSFVWDVKSQINGNFGQVGKKLLLNYDLNIAKTVFNNFRIISSNIGNVDLTEVETAIQFSIGSIISFINPVFGQNSIELPLPGYATVSNPSIKTTQRAVEITATPTFTFE